MDRPARSGKWNKSRRVFVLYTDRGRREHENITQEVNPMNRIQGTLTAIAVAMLVTLGVSCGGDPTPEPDVPTSPLPTSAPGVITSPPVSSAPVSASPQALAPVASRAPGPTSVKEFVVGWPFGNDVNVIVVATISSVLAEKMLGPYGEDGTALPADVETGWPITDYLVQIESVLKADDVAAGADTLVLRMFGYLSRGGQGPAGGPITVSGVSEMPKPGDHLLFVLGRNPDGTYGTVPGGLLNIDGATVAFADGYPFPFEMAPAQFMDEMRDAISRIISHKGTVASFSSSTLVLVVDGDELTFDITGAKIRGTLAQDAEVKIEAEDSPDGLVAITVVVKGKDILYLVSGGIINGQALDLGDTKITATPNSAIVGTVNIMVRNDHDAGTIFPVGATPSWGDHKTSYWQVDNWARPGITSYSVGVNLVAPSQPGTYFVIVAAAAETSLAHVMSATHSGSPQWDNGDDVASWSVTQIDFIQDNAYIFAASFPEAQSRFGATVIKVVVE